ncbi:MAG: ABC transporter ATP-binding protein [Spirochaetales bacterium]|nr:ABC transporter ATP-binding protein [Spirochaetales bacterium]
MNSSSTPALLNVDQLKIHFATPKGPLMAVRGISYSIARGETLGIVGESGSGKSVGAMGVLDLLPGNTILREGTVHFDGKSVTSMTPRELRAFRGSGIGTIFQEPGRSFDPIYTIGKTMQETAAAHFPDMEDKDITELCVRRLEEVHVPEARQRLTNYPHQFSGGLLQRIMIATALLTDPALLIADEPTTSLDVTIQAGIIELLKEIKETRGLSILFITHDLALISTIADRIIVMYAGLIMEEGPTEEVLSRPRHPYTRALLDTIPRLGDHYTVRKISSIKGTIPDPTAAVSGCPFEPRCPLAAQSCKASLPAFMNDGTVHRCLFPGPKQPGLAGNSQGGPNHG